MLWVCITYMTLICSRSLYIKSICCTGSDESADKVWGGPLLDRLWHKTRGRFPSKSICTYSVILPLKEQHYSTNIWDMWLLSEYLYKVQRICILQKWAKRYSCCCLPKLNGWYLKALGPQDMKMCWKFKILWLKYNMLSYWEKTWY